MAPKGENGWQKPGECVSVSEREVWVRSMEKAKSAVASGKENIPFSLSAAAVPRPHLLAAPHPSLGKAAA